MKRNLKNSLSSLTWPWWFPYPSSWLRTLILVPIAFPLNALIIFGLVGILLSASEGNLIIFAIAAILGLILPTFILAFIYHIFWYKWQQSSSSKSRAGWFPRGESITQGLTATLVMMFSFTTLLSLFLSVIYLGCKLSFAEAGQEIVSECMARSLGRITGAIARQTSQVWDLEGRGVFVQYREQIDARPWFFIWAIIAAYFYQAEYGIKKYFIPFIKKRQRERQKIVRHPQQTAPKSDPLDVELARLRGDMGLTAVRQSAARGIPAANPKLNSKKRQLSHLLGLSLASLIGTLVFYFGWYYLSGPQPTAVAPSPTITTPQPEPFSAAVRAATQAAQLAQTAKTSSDWQSVAAQWQNAADLMESVPSDSAQFSLARQKEIEYEKNFQYAKTNAEKRR